MRAGLDLRGLAAFGLDLLLPPRCLACGGATEGAGALCAPCWRKMNFMSPPWCACCGLPFPYDEGDGTLCAGCLAGSRQFDRARSVFAYDDHSRGLVLALKHGDRHQGVPAFGAWLARAGADLLADAELVAPVPLHWTRLFRRRYNQAALLAGATVRASARPELSFAPDLLTRRRRTPSQGHRTRLQRAENVRSAFVLRRHESAEGKRIVLVDDVLTSGATVEECARVLRRAGAARVDVLTLARAVRLA
jgi:ComF family protein